MKEEDTPSGLGRLGRLMAVGRMMLALLHPGRLTTNARNLAMWLRMMQQRRAAETWWDCFSPEEYLNRHPDVTRQGVNPCLHFLIYGNEEKRRPSAQFDLDYYLMRYPDVWKSGINGLIHYALFGRAEGRTLNRPESEPSPAALRDTRPAVEDAQTPGSASAQQLTIVVNNQWLPEAPLLSVVIPCFNYGRFVEEAIRSVLEQTWTGVEILVVDGGSTEESTIRELQLLEAEGLPGVRFFYREGRQLVGDNRNFGISRARGRYVCCLDADDVLDPIYLEVALFLAEGYGYDVVYCSAQCFGASEIRWMITDADFPGIAQDNQIPTTAMFRRSAWSHVGGYRDWGLGDEHVPEDWDFWVRLLGHGYRPKAIREPLFRYRVHGSGLSSTSGLKLPEQRRQIREANAALLGESGRGPAPPLEIQSRWVNISASAGDKRPGFLLALPFVTVGGAETLIHSLAEEVVRQGFRLIAVTTLALPETVPDDWKKFRALTRHVYPLAHLVREEGSAEEFVFHLIRRYGVTHLFFAGCELIYHALPRLKREFPDLAVIDQLFNEKVHAANNRYYRRHIDTTVVPSQALKTSLFELAPEELGDVRIIPHAVRSPAPSTRGQSAVRAALGILAETTLVAYFGRLSPEKGADVFVEIARRLSKYQNYFFVMTGEGPERSRVLGMIERYGLARRFHTPGFVEELNDLMWAADIVVVPSLVDGMPLVVLEAQAREKPVVASAVGSIPTMIRDGETGYVCSPGDVGDFKRRIEELAGSADLRARIGRAARVSVLADYCADRMLRNYVELLRASATGQRPGEPEVRCGSGACGDVQ